MRQILLHYFVAYIHPFFDGNGRTVLFYFTIIKYGLKSVEFLSISAHLKIHGKRYERSFENAVKYQGDVTYFIDFSLDSLLLSLQKVGEKVDYLINIGRLKEKYSLNDLQISLIQRLALKRFRKITIAGFANDIHQTHEIARLELKKLTQLKLLIEESQKNKLFYTINSKFVKELVESFSKGQL